MTKILVLALGNPLRSDDGAGALVLEGLRTEDTSSEVELLDGGTFGLETILEFRNRELVVILDAVDFGAAPGKWARFELDALLSGSTSECGNLHSLGLTDALRLAEALGLLPPRVVLYGVQPESLEYGHQISPGVRRAVPEILCALRQELGQRAHIGVGSPEATQTAKGPQSGTGSGSA